MAASMNATLPKIDWLYPELLSKEGLLEILSQVNPISLYGLNERFALICYSNPLIQQRCKNKDTSLAAPCYSFRLMNTYDWVLLACRIYSERQDQKEEQTEDHKSGSHDVTGVSFVCVVALTAECV